MHRLIHHFLLFTVIALSVHLASAQMSIDKGIQFEHNLSWTQIKAKANSEQKYIFVDCYATWCGPCKFMRAIIFPQQAMGDFFNDRFVSVPVAATAPFSAGSPGWPVTIIRWVPGFSRPGWRLSQLR